MPHSVSFTVGHQLKAAASSMKAAEDDHGWRRERMPHEVVTEFERRLTRCRETQHTLEQRFQALTTFQSFCLRNCQEVKIHINECHALRTFISPYWARHDEFMHERVRSHVAGLQDRTEKPQAQGNEQAGSISINTLNAIGSMITVQLGPEATIQSSNLKEPSPRLA